MVIVFGDFKNVMCEEVILNTYESPMRLWTWLKKMCLRRKLLERTVMKVTATEIAIAADEVEEEGVCGTKNRFFAKLSQKNLYYMARFDFCKRV